MNLICIGTKYIFPNYTNLSLSTFTLVRSKDWACKTYREACKPNWWQCVWPICHWDSHPHHCIYNSYVGSHSFLFGAIGVGPSKILCLRKRAQFPIEYKIGDHVDCWEDSYKFPGVENIVIVISVVIIRKQNKICWEHLGCLFVPFFYPLCTSATNNVLNRTGDRNEHKPSFPACLSHMSLHQASTLRTSLEHQHRCTNSPASAENSFLFSVVLSGRKPFLF